MPDEPVDHVQCASYTHARRHPLVIGKIAGWTPPFQLSLTQLGVLLLTALAMAQTWRLWALRLPPALALVVGVGVPVGLTWAVRRVRVEGRSLARAALGWLALWSVPSAGVVLGRAHRERRPVALGGVRMSVAAEPPPAAGAGDADHADGANASREGP
jgi:hypothetical protein